MTAIKTPAKTTKKTATQIADEASEVELDAKFEEFRARAIDVQGGSAAVKVTNEPFIAGTNVGFSRELKLYKPRFKTRMAVDIALARGEALRLIQLVFADEVDYVLDELDIYENETGNDPIDILNGIVYAWYEHFFGKDSADRVFRNASA